ncbi:hypothetical protein C8Q78DRAFT_552915 [Trametes maxima]|nr:hypothetical protein C8Q78DRAFT_552915 [Trametes maxima]
MTGYSSREGASADRAGPSRSPEMGFRTTNIPRDHSSQPPSDIEAAQLVFRVCTGQEPGFSYQGDPFAQVVPPTDGASSQTRGQQSPSRPVTTAYIRPPPLRVPAPLGVRIVVPYESEDKSWGIAITVGSIPGLSLCIEGLMRDSPLNPIIANTVDNASMVLDSEFPDNSVCASALGLALDGKAVRSSTVKKDPPTDYKLGHLLTLLLQKQYRRWLDTAHSEKMDLRAIVGVEEAKRKNLDYRIQVRTEQLYVIAIRRRWAGKPATGRWCYFPVMEVRL